MYDFSITSIIQLNCVICIFSVSCLCSMKITKFIIQFPLNQTIYIYFISISYLVRRSLTVKCTHVILLRKESVTFKVFKKSKWMEINLCSHFKTNFIIQNNEPGRPMISQKLNESNNRKNIIRCKLSYIMSYTNFETIYWI